MFGVDNFGNTPLLEAIRNGNDRVASLLLKEGASLMIDDAGSFLCTAVARGDTDFLRRVLSNGIDPNSKDYDDRTPLHVATSHGLHLMAKLLVEAGASVFAKDRYKYWLKIITIISLLFQPLNYAIVRIDIDRTIVCSACMMEAFIYYAFWVILIGKRKSDI